MRKAALAMAMLLTASPAFAQLPGGLGKLTKAKETADKVQGLKVSEADERKIGEEVSLKVRQEFGVFQDKDVTKYVTLVGSVLAQASARPDLKWEFIVLDTDGVNAFAAPGGIVHITRGALGLIKSEAELACVLAHEVSHISKKHTVNSIQKSNTIKLGTDVTVGSREYISALTNAAYDNIVEKGFDRGDEDDADQEGVRLANKVGYNPSGLTTFLTKLMERNKGATERNGLFASHPETDDRIAKINKQIKAEKLAATALVAARYTGVIKFDAKPLSEITAVSTGAKGIAEGSSDGSTSSDGSKDSKDAKKEEPKKKGFSLNPLSKGPQKESTQASSSAGNRAIGKDRVPSGGGSNPNKLSVTVTPAEITQFKAGIA
jgi:Zn-dependent protease with chaperone function